jgi:hypothetical protein
MLSTAHFHGLLVAVLLVAACDDLSSFTTSDDEIYKGTIVQPEEVRKGFEKMTTMNLTLDIAEADTAPGQLTVVGTSDSGVETVLLDHAPLRPISSLKYDSLSSLDFPTGRLKNFMFSITLTGGENAGSDVLTVISLMSDGKVEVRLISGEERLYGIFSLTKEKL